MQVFNVHLPIDDKECKWINIYLSGFMKTVLENSCPNWVLIDNIKIKRKVSLFPPSLVRLLFIADLSLFFCLLHGLEAAFRSFEIKVKYGWFGTNNWHRFHKSCHIWKIIYLNYGKDVKTWMINMTGQHPLDSLVGRAVRRYRRGHKCESLSSLNVLFFQASIYM